MHRPAPAPRRLLALLLAASALCAQATPDDATPAPQSDLVLQLLQDRGVLPAAMSTDPRVLVRQVRDAASDLVISAVNFLGVPYRRGGNTPDEGFDCSGFTRHIVERSLGLVLPRRAHEQARQAGLLKVGRHELRPGDLVFFDTMRRAFSHVGIYVGDGKFIHAPRSGGAVRVESMGETYWTRRFNGARRVAQTSPAPVAAKEWSGPSATAPGTSTPAPFGAAVEAGADTAPGHLQP